MRAPFMRRVTITQPLSSVEAFALALVEASSRLTPSLVAAPEETVLDAVACDGDAIAAAE